MSKTSDIAEYVIDELLLDISDTGQENIATSNT